MELFVLNKKDNKEYKVYDIIYDNTGYPHFLIYKDDNWSRVSAKHYKPIINNSIFYGVIKEYKNYDLWFEPITDIIDGFVIRNKDGSIKELFVKKEQMNNDSI